MCIEYIGVPIESGNGLGDAQLTTLFNVYYDGSVWLDCKAQHTLNALFHDTHTLIIPSQRRQYNGACYTCICEIYYLMVNICFEISMCTMSRCSRLSRPPALLFLVYNLKAPLGLRWLGYRFDYICDRDRLRRTFS